MAIDDLPARTPKRLVNALLEIRCAHSDDIYPYIRPSHLQIGYPASGEGVFFRAVAM